MESPSHKAHLTTKKVLEDIDTTLAWYEKEVQDGIRARGDRRASRGLGDRSNPRR